MKYKIGEIKMKKVIRNEYARLFTTEQEYLETYAIIQVSDKYRNLTKQNNNKQLEKLKEEIKGYN